MKIYIKYNNDGEILSVMKAEVWPEEVETPFVMLEENEGASEVKVSKELEKLEGLEIMEAYKYDISEKSMVKKK